MSDTSKPTVAGKPADGPEPPRTINLAIAAIYAQIALSVLRAGLLWAYTGSLKQSLIDANNTRSAKDKLVLCGSAHPKGCLDVAHQVQVSLIELTVGSILISLAVLMCARKIRHGVRSARTMFVVLSIIGSFVGFAGSPLSVLALGSGGPLPLLLVTGLAGLASLAAIIALFLSESTRFFPRPVRSGAPSRGLGGLFAPRPPAGDKTAPATGTRSTAGLRAPANETAKVANSGARAKGRADEAAVARGAALARSRAKASKSRRTEL
ncbi:MAG: hypothetical protein ABR604_06770 [Jatrophihabitantaceae bacterium]